MCKEIELGPEDRNYTEIISRALPYDLNQLAYDYVLSEEQGQRILRFYAIPEKKAVELIREAAKKGQNITRIGIGEDAPVNLLPQAHKQKMKQEQGQRKIRHLSLLLLGALFLVNAAFFIQNYHLEQQSIQLSKALKTSHDEISEAKQFFQKLNHLDKTRRARGQILELILLLGEKEGLDLVLQKLAVRTNEVLIEAETAQHSIISYLVDSLSALEFVKAAKLEHTKMQKKLNQDYLQFKIGVSLANE